MAIPKYYCAIDFDKDGDFEDAGEDVTSDVRVTGTHSFKLTRQVNLRQHRVNAAVLELFLNNEDNKYSPFNPDSVLNDPATNTSVFPAPNIWFMAAYPADDFNGTDTTTLNSHTPSHDSNFSWSGDASSFEIDTNKIKSSSAADLQAVLDFGESDCYVGVRFTRGSTGGGLILRYVDTNNYWLVRHDGTNILLDEILAGTQTNRGSATFTWSAGDEKWILAQMHGDEFFISVDNELVLVVTDATHKTATKHGIGGKNTHANDRWEDFGGWNSLFFGRIDSISPRPEIDNQYTYIRAFDEMERENQHQVYRVSPFCACCSKADPKLIIGEILNATGFGVDCCGCLVNLGNRILDCGTTLTHNVQHQKSLGREALTELYQVQDDDVGLFYFDGHGRARYEGSCHRNSAPHSTALTTWSTTNCGSQCDEYIGQRWEWDDGKERVENDIWYLYNKISDVCCGVEVWRLNDTAAILQDKPAIAANGGTFTTLAIGSGDVIACPTTPVATTDFLTNTLTCGTGTNLTACTTAALECGFEGNFRLVTLTNNSASAGFVTFLRLRAQKHTVSAQAGARGQCTTSQTDNGRRRIQHTSLHIDEFDTAEDRAQKRASLRGRPKEKLQVRMENGTKANLINLLHRNISDRVDLTFTSLSITNTFNIEGLTLTGRDGGLHLQGDWLLQEAFGFGWGFIKYRTAAGDPDAGTYA